MMLDGAEECQLSGPIGELVPFTTPAEAKGLNNGPNLRQRSDTRSCPATGRTLCF